MPPAVLSFNESTLNYRSLTVFTPELHGQLISEIALVNHDALLTTLLDVNVHEEDR